MQSSGVIGFGLLFLMGVGCGAHEHIRMGTELDHSQILSDAYFSEPMPDAYAHLEVAETVFAEAAEEPQEEGEKSYPFPREAFDVILAEMLRELGGFEKVSLAGEGGEGDPSVGLVLRLEVDGQEIRFRKRNSNTAWAIGGWILGIFAIPAQWVHDEIYGIRLRGKAIITDPATGEPVHEVDLGDCSAEDALNFHERTSSVVPYLLTNIMPPTAVSPDPRSLLEALMPIALHDAMVELRDGFQAIAAFARVDRYRIVLPESEGVAFEFESPRDGEAVAGETVSLRFDLIFPKDSTDLEIVAINGKEEIKYDPRRPIPVRKRMTVEVEDVPLVNGRITISVSLFSRVTPVEAVIRVQGGGE